MQFANEGDLKNKIKTYRQHAQHIPEPEIWKALLHVTQGLQKLHSNKILHRDIKSANIFISNGVYKLGDFNVAKIRKQENSLANTHTGTPYYSSPQIWNDQAYGQKSDIWSLGCLLYQMCCWCTPFKGNNIQQLYNNIMKGKYQEVPSFYSKELRKIIASCLHKNPKKRPDTLKLLSQQSIVVEKCYQLGIQIQNFIEFLGFDVGFRINRKGSQKSKVMKTINLPSNLKLLKNKLPKPNYSGRNNQSLFQNQNNLQHSIQIVKQPFVHKKYSNISNRNLKSDKSNNQKSAKSIVNEQKVQQNGSQKCIIINPKKSFSYLGSARRQKVLSRQYIKQQQLKDIDLIKHDQQAKITTSQQQKQQRMSKKRSLLLQLGKRKGSEIKQRNASRERIQNRYPQNSNRLLSMKNLNKRQEIKQNNSFLYKQNGICSSRANQHSISIKQLSAVKQNLRQKISARQRLISMKNRYFQQAVTNKRSLLPKSKQINEVSHIQSVMEQKKIGEYQQISKAVKQVRNKIQDQFNVKKINSFPYMSRLIAPNTFKQKTKQED